MIGRGTTCTAALALAGVMLATGCGRPAPEPWPHETDVSDHELPAGDPILDDASIFDLDIPLVDQHGDRWRLGDLGGRPMIAAMIYTSCTAVCLRITDELRLIERQLGDRSDVQFVLFSLDPGRDTPEAMNTFARARGLDPERWRLLAASEDDVRSLAAVLWVRYQPLPDGEIAHSALVFVIDADGVVRHRQVGVRQDPRELVGALGRVSGS